MAVKPTIIKIDKEKKAKVKKNLEAAILDDPPKVSLHIPPAFDADTIWSTKSERYTYDPEEVLDEKQLNPSFDYFDETYKLEDDQWVVIKGILKWMYENPIYSAPYKRIAGFAGTGKTLLISYLINTAAETFPSYMRHKSICVCTFTWKAALVLRSKNVEAQSIHSIFYKPKTVKGGGLEFERRPPEEIREAYCIIVIDEASMVDSITRKDIEAIGLPVIYVGDSGQLPAISNDPEDATFMEKAEFKLTKIRRQALDSAIIRLSIDIRNGKWIKYGKYGDGVFKVEENEVSDNLMLKTDQILCGKNNTRLAINREIRTLKGYNHRRMPYEGEKLIGRNNHPDRQMYNGQTWFTTSDSSEFKLVDSHRHVLNIVDETGHDAIQQCWFAEDSKLRSFTSEAQTMRFMKDNGIYYVDFGYAMTVHKGQGSSYKRPIIFEEFLGDKTFHKKWLYTGVTRAIDKVIIVS